MTEAVLFNIQRFSTHDGPGIRTVVFFKGCPLRCRWCHNPESQLFIPEIMHNAERCALCGKCVEGCPAGAISIRDSRVITDTARCEACRVCADECLNCARELAGEKYSAEKIMDVIKRDRTYYEESGGGVTFSGGECLSQSEALLELLKSCRRIGIHTAVDTCGLAPWAELEKTVPFTDLYLYDVKCIDPEKHRALTGSDNRVILENLRRLKALGANIWLRLPLIAGQNCSDADIAPLLSLARELRPSRVSLLPYHNTGSFKYSRLNRTCEEFSAPSPERLDEIKKSFEADGHDVRVGA